MLENFLNTKPASNVYTFEMPQTGVTLNADRVKQALEGEQSGIVLVDDMEVDNLSSGGLCIGVEDDGKLKDFRQDGGIVKTEEEKRQMAEKHRFKKNRDFKQRLEETEQNEEGDIRSFTFHHHDLEKKERRERPFRKNDSEREERGDRKGGYKGRDSKGGHDRFDRHAKGRSYGKGKDFGKKRNFSKGHTHDDDEIED